LGVGGLLMAGMIAPGVAREAKANLTAAKAGLGGQIVTPQDIETRRQQMGLGASKGMASMAGGF
jgi:hypothetical protein